MMNRWLSQTRVMAARTSSRIGRYCAWRSRSGTDDTCDDDMRCASPPPTAGRRPRSAPDDQRRRAPQRAVVVEVVPAAAGDAGVDVQNELDVASGVLGE